MKSEKDLSVYNVFYGWCLLKYIYENYLFMTRKPHSQLNPLQAKGLISRCGNIVI